jgi:hypothetical protein
LIHKNKNIKVVVLDPIPFESIRDMDSKELATRVHDLIAIELNREIR